MRTLMAILIASLVSFPALAACDLDRVVGYTLAARKTVVAKIENDQREDGFTGCSYNRILVFDDNTGLRCAEYNYHYAYRPEAFIFVNSYSIKACIDGEMMDLQPLR